MTAETNKIALHQPKNNLQAWQNANRQDQIRSKLWGLHQNAAEKIKEGRNDLPEPLEGDAGLWSGMTTSNHRHDDKQSQA